MRYAIALAVLLMGCQTAPQQDGPMTKAHREYTACLDAKGVDGCAVEKAKLEAAIAYSDAATRRANSERPAARNLPPLILEPYQPPPMQPIQRPPGAMMSCYTVAGITNCY